MSEFLASLEMARKRMAEGWRPQNLLMGENIKLKKGLSHGWRGMGLSLAPARTSGYEVCASRSEECTRHCIFTSGKGMMFNVQWGRIFRTLWYYEDRKGFMLRLMSDIQDNQSAAIRLNVFSDIMWERTAPEIFHDFPNVQFYDYTKHFRRMFKRRPSNYHLTYSLSESNVDKAYQVLKAGYNISAIVAHPAGHLWGYPLLDGDEHDLRFLDPQPSVVGLRAKGSLRKAESNLIYVPELHRHNHQGSSHISL
jgi:hypothetical protein